MFGYNFNSEKAIKSIAVFIMGLGLVLLGLSIIASLILLCIDAEDYWWISLTVFGSAIAALISTAISATIVWGFGDLCGDVKKIACNNQIQSSASEEIELPEL